MYEIPQQLRYEEKILFGLTLEQFGAIAVFGLLAALIYFKINTFFELRVASVIILGTIGLGFAFFDFKNHIKNIVTFWRSPRKVGFLDKKARNFVEVRDVASDLIYMKDGSVRAVVQVYPINFGIKNEQEKEAIIENYQAFLNSLTFPIQILMRTVNLNLDDYMDAFEKQVGDLVQRNGQQGLIQLFHDYRDFMDKFIEKNAIENRLFYIVIPLRPTAKKKKERQEQTLKEMEIRVNLVQEKLAAMGLQTRKLNTDQLISLLASFFEGRIEVENDYLSPITLLEEFKKEVKARGKVYGQPEVRESRRKVAYAERKATKPRVAKIEKKKKRKSRKARKKKATK